MQDIERRLDDRFSLLHDPASRQPPRQRAVAEALSWSYDLLFPDDRRGLWALACFAGSASLDATEHVLRALDVPSGAVLDVITRLVDRSLVSVEVDEHGDVRYRLLDSIRAYAVDRLAESGLRQVALAAHASWYAAAAGACDAAIRGPGQARCLALVRAEGPNIDAALAWAAGSDPGLGTRIANGFGWAWVVLGEGVAAATRLRAALSPLAPAADQARSHLLAGWLEASAGDVGRADADLTEALAIADALDDEVLRADAHRHWAFVCIQQGRPQDVRDHAASALATYRRVPMTWQTAGTLLLSAYGAIMLGDPATAADEAGLGVRLLTELGDQWGVTHGQALLGAIAAATHRFDDAAESLTAAVEASEQLGFSGQAALHLTTLARVKQRTGDLDGARGTLARAIAAATRGGDLRLAATARVHLARVLRAQGDRASARAVLHVADDWYRAAGGGDGALLARCLLCSETGDRAGLDSVLADALAGGHGDVAVHALDALARASAEAGDRERAVRLLTQADLHVQAVDHALDEVDRADKADALRLLGSPPA